MNNKRKWTLAAVAAVLVGTMIVGAGTAFAQGGGGYGRGAGGNANGAGIALHADATTGTALGSGFRYGQQAGYQAGLADPQTNTFQQQTSVFAGRQSRGQNGLSQNGLGQSGLNQNGLNQNGLGQNASTLVRAEADLDAEALAALEAGLADEINAYAIYGAIIEQFGPIYPFVQIQQSEASHIASLQAAYERYGLVAPEIAPAEDLPVFESVADACAAGAAAEIANFGLYDQWIASVSEYPDLTLVFTALRNASEFNHLPAFEACAG